MDICDFFDIHDRDHLVAWLSLSKTGLWPKGFIPEGITFQTQWQAIIVWRLAGEYVKEKVGE